MYPMKSIIDYDAEITLPTCMYTVKSIIDYAKEDDINLNISSQVMKFLKGSKIMSEVEHRQDELLQKLDDLYDRIKALSFQCQTDKKNVLRIPKEVSLIVSPDNLPWYLNILLKEPSMAVSISWHIHSSVPVVKEHKIKHFISKLSLRKNSSKVNIRMVFKSSEPQLQLSSLDIPIVGNVNILRYLSFIYPDEILYNFRDFKVDNLLDMCHMLERASERNREALVNKLCSQQQEWLYGKEFSIVDLAAYNAIKQLSTIPKYVPKSWFDKCETKLCL